jgi:hypothetical protein
VGHCIDFVAVHDGGADGYGAGALTGGDAPVCAVALQLHFGFLAVVGHVDEGRVEFEKGIDAFVDLADVLSFQRG